VILTTLSASNCSRRVRFDPDAYRANSYLEAIVNENQVTVYCYEPQFDKFACMHEDKWKELRRLLQDARIPNKIKKQLLLEIDKITDLPK
jgi:hypothetical protein